MDKTLAATNFEKSLMSLLSKIIADMTAIRHLVLVGFDTSARTVLRSLSEYLKVLVGLVRQPDLSDALVMSDSPEDAQRFWQTHLSSNFALSSVRCFPSHQIRLMLASPGIKSSLSNRFVSR
jgi:hypothetical protein